MHSVTFLFLASTTWPVNEWFPWLPRQTTLASYCCYLHSHDSLAPTAHSGSLIKHCGQLPFFCRVEISRGICHHFPTDMRSTPSSAFCPPESYASSGVGSPPISGLLGPWDVSHSLGSVHCWKEPTGCLLSFQCASVWTKCHSSPCSWKGLGGHWLLSTCQLLLPGGWKLPTPGTPGSLCHLTYLLLHPKPKLWANQFGALIS